MFSLGTEDFSLSLDVLHGGLGIKKGSDPYTRKSSICFFRTGMLNSWALSPAPFQPLFSTVLCIRREVLITTPCSRYICAVVNPGLFSWAGDAEQPGADLHSSGLFIQHEPGPRTPSGLGFLHFTFASNR